MGSIPITLLHWLLYCRVPKQGCYLTIKFTTCSFSTTESFCHTYRKKILYNISTTAFQHSENSVILIHSHKPGFHLILSGKTTAFCHFLSYYILLIYVYQQIMSGDMVAMRKEEMTNSISAQGKVHRRCHPR